MTTSSNTATAPREVLCPAFCQVPMEDHLEQLADDGAIFHRGEPIDAWEVRQGSGLPSHPVSVYAEEYYAGGNAEPKDNLVIIEGNIGRGSQDMAELEPQDARRLAAALIAAADCFEVAR